MTKLVKVLYESSTLDDFVKLVTQLSQGTLDAMNMSFLLCQEVVKLQSLQTTTNMRFRKETKLGGGVSNMSWKRTKIVLRIKKSRLPPEWWTEVVMTQRKVTITLLYPMRSP